MDSQDNVIVFPVPKPKFDFGDLYDFVVYSDDKGLVTGCHCFDCKVVHICGYLSISNDEYELVEAYIRNIYPSIMEIDEEIIESRIKT